MKDYLNEEPIVKLEEVTEEEIQQKRQMLEMLEKQDKDLYLKDESEVDVEEFRNAIRNMFSQEEEPLYSPKEYDFSGLAEAFSGIGSSFATLGETLHSAFSNLTPDEEEALNMSRKISILQEQLKKSNNYMEQNKLRKEISDNKRKLSVKMRKIKRKKGD